MNDKIKTSIANLKSAYKKLEEFLSLPIENDRDRSGIIKAFEFTFELSWKTFQKMAIKEGLDAAGPRSCLKLAFQLNIIDNTQEHIWLKMLDDRNLVSHTYRDKLSREIVERIKDEYKKSFHMAIENLERF